MEMNNNNETHTVIRTAHSLPPPSYTLHNRTLVYRIDKRHTQIALDTVGYANYINDFILYYLVKCRKFWLIR